MIQDAVPLPQPIQSPVSLVPYNPKKHRRSLRLPDYDHTQPGDITICTYQRQRWFGGIGNGKMHCNHLSYIVSTFWQALPQRFPHIEFRCFCRHAESSAWHFNHY